ncbi:MAG: hypothetical protein Kow0010_21940 [Dehalococcoidia bacterium]
MLSPEERALRDEVAAAVARAEAVMSGVARQEILSGLSDPVRFDRLRDALRAVEDEPASADDHERAAEMFNLCRAAGAQGSAVDFLICAVAERLDAAILSADRDFGRFEELLPIRLLRLA